MNNPRLTDVSATDAQGHKEYSTVLLLKVEEAALRLGIARTSMFRLLAEGEVSSVQVGRLRRIPVACLEEYVARLRDKADHPEGA